jgi:hypothetical protein
MRAYDIDILPRPADRTRDDGWCFGLPPGISPEQWPLDPTNGYPLMHVFTILLPEDYRIHGPDLVALSFFATAHDHNDGGPTTNAQIEAVIATADPEPPSDPDLRPFWEAERRRHPHMNRMTDILGCGYAAILLTREEFEGPLAEPPRRGRSRALERVKPPRWLEIGSAAAYWDVNHSQRLSLPAEEHGLYRTFGQIPDRRLAFSRALAFTPRANDPNAGIAPREDWSAEKTGYVLPYYWEGGRIEAAHYRNHDWGKDHMGNHIGGTMRPSQAIPAFSPYYIEFGEECGGCNFGGGNAQLDFRDMAFDWACG